MMIPTTKAMAAINLGVRLQLLKWKAYQDEYTEQRSEIARNLDEIDVAFDLPDTAEEVARIHDELLKKILEALTEERRRLGGDVYALPLFWLGYVPHELVLSAAWKSANYEPLLEIMHGVLQDLGIEGELEGLKTFIDRETAWLAQLSERDDGNLHTKDVGKAATRLIGRIQSLWQAADQGGRAVPFDRVPYHSVFISYSSKDQEFSDSLFTALDERGVQVWYAPDAILPGRKLAQQIHGAIAKQDKFVVVLSEGSLGSGWVDTELYKARQRELSEGVQLVFPIRLVSYDRIREWSAFDADSGRDMAREIREYFIPDFTNWRDDAAFEKEFERLLKALMVENAPAREGAVPG